MADSIDYSVDRRPIIAGLPISSTSTIRCPIYLVGREQAEKIWRSDIPLRWVFSHHHGDPLSCLSERRPVDDGRLGFAPEVREVVSFDYHDVEYSVSGRLGYQACTENHIRALVSCLQAVPKTPGPVLVHCHAGIGRSSATVLGLLAVLYPGDTRRIMESLDAIVEWNGRNGYREDPISPNRRVVAYLDRILGYNGTLRRAVQHSFYKNKMPFRLEDEPERDQS